MADIEPRSGEIPDRFQIDWDTLIPASDDLITNIDTNRRQIIMQIPEGLLEI